MSAADATTTTLYADNNNNNNNNNVNSESAFESLVNLGELLLKLLFIDNIFIT